ncbi:MAG: DUF4340 domain-containing protein [Flavobacteriales bacterium]|jgi:hypothetical protein|nr:DUF4340 domain-containing protein [Flavobacteriales bacterium]
MKKNLLILLLILIGAFVIFYLIKRDGDTSRIDRYDFSIANIDQVDKIVITSKTPNVATLEKIDTKSWKLNGKYIANRNIVGNLLETLNKMQVKHPVPKNQMDGVLKQMVTSAVKVDVYIKNKKLKSIYIGKDTPNQKGTFMMIEGAKEPWAVFIPGHDGFLSGRFFTNEKMWRSKRILDFPGNDIAEIKMEYHKEKNASFIIDNSNDKPILKNLLGDKKEGNTTKLGMYIGSFKKIACEGYIHEMDPVQPSQIMNMPKAFDLSILTKDGTKKTITAFEKSNLKKTDDGRGFYQVDDRERFYATDGESYFIIQLYVFDKLLKKVGDFK